MWLVSIGFPVLLLQVTAYHQDDYTLKLQRAECSDYNRSYASEFKLGLNWFNRSTRVINARFYLLKQLSRGLRTKVQVLKFLSNEYRFFPITLNNDACLDFELDPFGLQQSFRQSLNFEPRCPLKPGLHTITNAIIDFSKFPPFIPGGEYKIAIQMCDSSNFIFQVDFYAKVEEILKKWEN